MKTKGNNLVFAEAVLSLSKEVRSLFHSMTRTVELLHGQGEMTAARRGILLDLFENGGQTVPQLARKRQKTRQNIQVIVNQLIQDGLVENTFNPEHRRSSLIQISNEGKGKIMSMLEKEKGFLSALPDKMAPDDILGAAQVLKSLNVRLQNANRSLSNNLFQGE